MVKHTKKLIGETGNVYGILTVTKLVGNNKFGRAVWECKCQCGKTISINGSLLRYGKRKHCGCLRRYAMSANGLSQNVIYKAYRNARRRCTNKSCQKWPSYGGRGIEFKLGTREEFIEAMTASWFAGASLGRIDNNGHYEYGNIRWETAKQQGSNKRNSVFYTYAGRTLIQSDWAREFGVDNSTIRNRINKFGVDIAFSSLFKRESCRG